MFLFGKIPLFSGFEIMEICAIVGILQFSKKCFCFAKL
jgi:hypothetical protein